MNGLAICAGVAGLDLGIELAIPGHRTVCFVERDAYASAALVARMEAADLAPAPIWDDLKSFRGRPWRGLVEVISAGFPCPPVSCAGKGLGVEDERWLWPEVARVIREVGPRFVILENVSGLLTHPRAFGDVLGELASLGFDAEWDCIPAEAIGAPHRRDRLFVVAWRVSDTDSAELWHLTERGEDPTQEANSGNPEPEHLGEQVADCDCDCGGCESERESGEQRQRWEPGARGNKPYRRSGPQLDPQAGTPVEHSPRIQRDGRSACKAGPAERQPKTPSLWPPPPSDLRAWGEVSADSQPAVCRMADGLASRVDRLRCTGNGVVPLQAAVAIRVLAHRAAFGRG